MKKKQSVVTFILMLLVLAFTVLPAGAAPPSVQLTGRTTFAGFFSTSGFVFSPDWYNYCSAEAVLTQTGEQTYSLQVDEWDCGRVCTWELKITNGGVVMGEGYASCVPECVAGSCAGEVQLHTGCDTGNGTFSIYHGTWDGHTLSIASRFHGRCDGGTYWGESWFWDGWGDIPSSISNQAPSPSSVSALNHPLQLALALRLLAAR
jgi:hypothetical protein